MKKYYGKQLKYSTCRCDVYNSSVQIIIGYVNQL